MTRTRIVAITSPRHAPGRAYIIEDRMALAEMIDALIVVYGRQVRLSEAVGITQPTLSKLRNAQLGFLAAEAGASLTAALDRNGLEWRGVISTPRERQAIREEWDRLEAAEMQRHEDALTAIWRGRANGDRP